MNYKSQDRWFWVIGGGLLQIPLIEEAKMLGLKVLVTDMNPTCVAGKYADQFETVDIFDIEGNLALCRKLQEKAMNIVGVLAAGIDAPVTMARLNEHLGLKGVSSETANTIQQKDLFRQAMREKGFPVPRFSVVKDFEDISSSFETVGFPLIVKPPANSASRDMKIFQTNQQEEASNFIKHLLKKYDRLIIEEMWNGPEQTVECLVDIGGQFHRGFITDRHFKFNDGFPVETGLVHPTELGEDDQDMLYQLAQKLAIKFEISAGAVKLDTVLTTDGPRVIELTVRHSGGFDCQYLVPLSTGKNILKAAILTAIQERFPDELLEPRWEKYGVTGSVWPVPGKIKSIVGVNEAKMSTGVKHVFLRYQVGEQVLPYEDCARRAAFIICVTESRDNSRSCLKQAQQIIQFIIE